MELWLSTRCLPNYSNYHRLILSYTLHFRYNNSIFISNTYLSRRKLRLTNSIYTRKRSLNIFYLLVSSCRTRDILRIIYIYRNMKHWSYLTICSNSHSIHRLCSPMRANILLRSNSNYKPPFSNPLHRNHPSRMNLRGFLSRQSYSNTLLRLPLYPSIHYRSPSSCSPTFPPRNRLKQPNRPKLRR